MRYWRLMFLPVCWLVLLAAAQAGETGDAASARIRERVEALRETAAGAPNAIDDAISVFYAQRAFAPAWSDARRVDDLLGQLDTLRSDGLQPADYFVADLARARADPPGADAPARGDLDLLATRAYLLALSHLFRGKVDPHRLYAEWNFAPRDADVAQGLQLASAAIDAGRIDAAFAGARPQHPVYAAMRNALERLQRIASDGGWPLLPGGATLKPGMLDGRVPTLRRRLLLGGYLADDAAQGDLYDAALLVAVRAFQAEQYLTIDGHIGAQTLAALNVPVEQRVEQLRVNLERARWLLPEIKGDFVLVDIAGYKVSYYKGAQAVWSTRAQVGRAYRRTPSFKAQITYVTFNPTWTVPGTILRNDVLPKVRRDPGYLAANRLRVLDAAGREIAPEQVDWQQPRGIVLRQDAGPDNSLGRVAIRFPNPYDVFMHDTPHTELFEREQRAFSSGCIRIERPLELVQLLLDDSGQWSREAIDRAVAAGMTRTVPLREPLTLLLMYWSIDLHEDGRVAYKQDVYDNDRQVRAALDASVPH